ncbi:MAG: hypothetical protein DCC43_02095 [Candidatus Brocadia sp.]|jgi:hypothetical protein|uniref:SnoaL-like domain-containing protein n=1 Tax=Candidatus Brocadia fulgida TaxID=380242 RepID=A0A0M2UVZ3_9BACT|nr:MAG: hypothetical protein BROFUL_02620 [Candidatus Brocadia fulgida]MCC6325773.1 hypothetical protein [Candidatus Brocadia sp.]MCE7910811.1 hypothetical protein [Candidatus Brocadia sp. AMX3]MBV6519119.1 hypothetical protein [Candidatus Brocadia fulgida]MDG5996790.1 hypothetical protein [Candidatus Brocadia sp.]
MKKIGFVVFVVVMIFTRLSLAQDSPRVIVERYLDAVRNNDYDKAYSFISKTDTTIINWLKLIQYVKKIAPVRLAEVIDLAHHAVRQEIASVVVGGNTCLVKIHSRIPDMEEGLRITRNPEEIKSLLDRGRLPAKERFGECTLIKEDGMWKISKVKGVSSDQAADIAADFATLILGKDEAERMKKKIDDFMQQQEKGA